MKISCPSCHQNLLSDSSHAGQVIQCPACGTKLKVPAKPSTPSGPAQDVPKPTVPPVPIGQTAVSSQTAQSAITLGEENLANHGWKTALSHPNAKRVPVAVAVALLAFFCWHFSKHNTPWGSNRDSNPFSQDHGFGIAGEMTGGLIGHFYDLTQKPDHTKVSGAARNYPPTIQEFLNKGWDEKVLQRFYQAPDAMLGVQLFMPCSSSSGASKAFNVEKEAPHPAWVVHYKGVLVPERDMEIRFWCSSDDFCFVRVGGKIVGGAASMIDGKVPPDKVLDQAELEKVFPQYQTIGGPLWNGVWHWYGEWFSLKKGVETPIEILIGDCGGLYNQILLAEEKNPPTPYVKTVGDPQAIRLPLVQFRRGVPLPKRDPQAQYLRDGVTRTAPYDRNPEFADEPLVIPAK
jgi:DNA-directed RNA polymerase subunit RPC12/RpoP